jgi:hypothetical protein
MSLSINFFLCPSGTKITGQLVDGAGTICLFTGYGPLSSGAIPTYRKNGGSSIALPDPAEVNTDGGSSALIHWNMPVTFLSTDTVTISAVPNTFGGSPASVPTFVPAITNQAVSNRVGGSLFPAPPSPATLQAGVNLMPPGDALPYFSCFIQNNIGIIYGGSDPGPPALNPDLLPVFTKRDAYRWQIAFTGSSTADGKPYPAYPNGGTSTLVYSGGAGCFLYPNGDGGTNMGFVSQDSGHATGNTVKFSATLDGSGASDAPSFALNIVGGFDVVCSLDVGRTSSTGAWFKQGGAGFNGGYYKNDRLAGSVWTWHAGNLPAGNWIAYFSWPALAGNTQNAIYTIKESGASLGSTTTIDQTLTPTHAAVRDWNGVNIIFDPFGGVAFTCTGGPITIELHGDTLGDCVADSVQLQLVGNTTGSVPFTPVPKINLYDPSVDASNPPEFHLNCDRALEGMLTLRPMQMQQAMGAASDYADYATPTQSTYGAGGRNVYYLITKMEIWPNADGYWAGLPHPIVLVTVDSVNGSPLPIMHGRRVMMPGGVDMPYASGGGIVNMSSQDARIQYDPATMSTHQFAILSYGHSGSGTVNPIFPTNAYASINLVSTPWPSYFRRVASLPNCAAWPDLTILTTMACTQQIAADYLAAVPAGRKCYLEIGNEPWNGAGSGFPDYRYLFNEAVKAGITEMAMYARLAGQRHAWFKAILDAAGRGGELVRCFGCQLGNPSLTAGEVLGYCNANNIPVDMLLLADYFAYEPYNVAGLTALQGGLTAAQLADGVEASKALGMIFDPEFKLFTSLIATQNATHVVQTALGGYEGGAAGHVAGGDQATQERQSMSAKFHTQTRKTAFAHMGQLQAYGLSIYNQYCNTQPAVNDFTAYKISVYGIHQGYASRPGKGDGTDGLHNNLPDIAGVPPGPINLTLAVSPIAAGLRDWNASIGGGGGGGGTYKPSGAWEDGGLQNLGGIA